MLLLEQTIRPGSALALHCRAQHADGVPPRWFDIEARLLRDERERPLRWVGMLPDVGQIPGLIAAPA
ncbi:hypothetical protein [Azohydromonas australica]|uniref:hypothetical protein n=1 Tax=Azohydromonas australica TaxID=364039 RepID=UPI0004919180